MRTLARQKRMRLMQDALVIAVSLLLAGFIVQSEVVGIAVAWIHELEYVGSFFAGMLFTSAFTTLPSIAILSELAKGNSPFIVALLGALGATCGDFILYRFVRDRVAEDLGYLMKLPKAKRIARVFDTMLPRVLWPFLGALIIASPLPDELGIMLMGLSKMRQRLFVLLSFVMNFLGILVIGFAARAIGGGS